MIAKKFLNLKNAGEPLHSLTLMTYDLFEVILIELF